MPGRPSEIAHSSLAVSPESEPNPRCNPNNWATWSTFYLHILLWQMSNYLQERTRAEEDSENTRKRAIGR